mmetsp:Transcript_27023/g.37312  ORF Transcript_27023/g.37312 Transcript_27023/m.37312 type:complete len:101 (+) Transcript_27023:416-718(+)
MMPVVKRCPCQQVLSAGNLTCNLYITLDSQQKLLETKLLLQVAMSQQQSRWHSHNTGQPLLSCSSCPPVPKEERLRQTPSESSSTHPSPPTWLHSHHPAH